MIVPVFQDKELNVIHVDFASETKSHSPWAAMEHLKEGFQQREIKKVSKKKKHVIYRMDCSPGNICGKF